MFRTNPCVLWLGLVCVGLACSCSSADSDGRTSDSPITTPVGGAAGSVAGSGGTAATGTPVGSPAGAAAPLVAGSPSAPPFGGRGAAGIGGVAGAPGGVAGAPGSIGAAGIGTGAAGAQAGAAGRGAAGMAAAAGSGMTGMMMGAAGNMSMASGMGETGRMAGMTEAHNKVRAMVQATPPLNPLTWSPTLATYAQEWADNLAKTACDHPMHRSQQELMAKRYGENLAAAGGVPAPMTKAQWAVDGWASEVKCWTYGTFGAEFGGTEKCDTKCYQDLHSDGCGHYTAIIWRGTTEVGCGVASCQAGGATWDIWICNYSPPGNVVGQKPY